MICSKCNKRAVFSYPDLCKKHFISYFENNVKRTITKYNLITKKDRVVIACSGGKDSLTVLYLVNKFFHNVDAMAIDEGIRNYRPSTLRDLKNFCSKNKINLKIYSFKKELGMPLDVMRNKSNLVPCTVCGTFRRYLLNSKAKGYTKIATGHNMDDEVQSLLMNLLRNNLELSARLGPKTGLIKDKRFVQRVKPLYFCTEKEVMAYSILKNFPGKFVECPNAALSYRMFIRDMLNDYEMKYKGTKRNIMNNFIKTLPSIKKEFKTEQLPNYCEVCSQPSHGKICRACQLLETLKNKALNKKQAFISV